MLEFYWRDLVALENWDEGVLRYFPGVQNRWCNAADFIGWWFTQWAADKEHDAQEKVDEGTDLFEISVDKPCRGAVVFKDTDALAGD